MAPRVRDLITPYLHTHHHTLPSQPCWGTGVGTSRPPWSLAPAPTLSLAHHFGLEESGPTTLTSVAPSNQSLLLVAPQYSPHDVLRADPVMPLWLPFPTHPDALRYPASTALSPWAPSTCSLYPSCPKATCPPVSLSPGLPRLSSHLSSETSTPTPSKQVCPPSRGRHCGPLLPIFDHSSHPPLLTSSKLR